MKGKVIRMNLGERFSSLAWAVVIFAALLWSAAAMCDMSIPAFSMHVVGPFVADHPWALIVLVAVIILLLFDDVLDHLICALWDGIAYLPKIWARVIANLSPRRRKILPARRSN